MKEWYLDYPEWKEENPEGTMSEWQAYTRPIVYDYFFNEFENIKDELSRDEQNEVETILSEMKSRIDSPNSNS